MDNAAVSRGESVARSTGLPPVSVHWLCFVLRQIPLMREQRATVARLAERFRESLRAAGLRVVPLPGASSVTAALSVAGAVASGSADGGFVFAGFLPVKNAERASAVQRLAAEPRCVVLLEAPHRIHELAAALAVLGERPVTLARELTKQFEEISTHPARDLAGWLAGAPQRVKGEFVVLLHPLPSQQDDGADAQRVLRLLLGELPTKTAVKLAADITGAPRNALYSQALQIRQDEGPAD